MFDPCRYYSYSHVEGFEISSSGDRRFNTGFIQVGDITLEQLAFDGGGWFRALELLRDYFKDHPGVLKQAAGLASEWGYCIRDSYSRGVLGPHWALASVLNEHVAEYRAKTGLRDHYQYFREGEDIGPRIFVFGSNLSGVHGLGAAKDAVALGAITGRSEGYMDSCYAIPTKDYFVRGKKMASLPLKVIERSVNRFKRQAAQDARLTFMVTRIGCGLAGYKDSEVAPMFVGASGNCHFDERWKTYLENSQLTG